jgi:septum formation protein
MTFPTLLLASKSPRRHEIFEKSGFDFEVVDIDADENFPQELKGPEICEYLSLHKSQHYQDNLDQNLLITADTIVVVGDTVLNKPESEQEAFEMLQLLSGRSHFVYTGCTIRGSHKTHTFHDATEVVFYALTDEEIHAYIRNCKPFDKAGSYGIQDWMGLVGVKSITGCFYNVMGFPSGKFYRELQHFLKP